MSLRSSGSSILRKAFSGRFVKNLKSKNFMSTNGCNPELQSQPDCCKIPCMMDEITHPEGCWATHNAKRDAENNQILAVGVVSFLICAYLVKQTDVVKGYPNVTLF